MTKANLFKTIVATCMITALSPVVRAQDTKPGIPAEDSTALYGNFAGTIARGTLIKTASRHFYEINDKISQKVMLPAGTPVMVYKEGKKYKIMIKTISGDKLLSCNKVEDVVESYIDGDFKGYDGNTTFKLVNSEQWKQDAPTSSVFANLYRPAVVIYRTSEGYKMKITGVNEDPILVVKK